MQDEWELANLFDMLDADFSDVSSSSEDENDDEDGKNGGEDGENDGEDGENDGEDGGNDGENGENVAATIDEEDGTEEAMMGRCEDICMGMYTNLQLNIKKLFSFKN